MKSKVKQTILILFFYAIPCQELEIQAVDLLKELGSVNDVHFSLRANDGIMAAGVAVPALGKKINPESVKKPKKIPVNTPKVVQAHSNIHVASPFQVTPKMEVLTVITPGRDGVPWPNTALARGKKVTCYQPEPTPAMSFRIKDAATHNIQYLDVDQGMLSSYVWSVIEDSKGNLWIGSNEGVSRYDGNSFTHYTTAQGLGNNRARSLLEDSQGDIWIGTDGGGVSRYDGSNFIHYTIEEGLNDNHVWSMLEDRQGNIWFGTESGGVTRYDGLNFTHFTVKEGLGQNTVWSMLEDRQGNIWFGTQGAGVSRYDGKSFTHFTMEQGLSDNRVWSMLEDSRGNLWFGTEGGGLSFFNGISFTHYREAEGLEHNAIWTMLEDRQGNLWCGTQGGGVSCFDGTSFTHHGIDDGLSSNRVRSLLEDSHGNLWFGTRGGGVNRYNPNSFTQRAAKEGLSDNNVLSMLEDSQGNLWFGTWAGGVNRYDGLHYTHYTTEEGLRSNMITCMLEDRYKNLWFGTEEGGVTCFDGRSFTNYGEEEGLLNNNVQSMVEDKSGNLWFGSHGGGVSCYDGTAFTHYGPESGLCHTMRCMLQDRQGNLWFGTQGGGVVRYDGSTFTRYTTAEGLSNDRVWCMMQDSEGNLWFGTQGGGVSRYDGSTFSSYQTDQGLSHNWIWSIQEDSSKNVWLSTENGLTVLVPLPISSFSTVLSEGPTFRFFNFGKADGLKRLDYGQGVCLDHKNRIWWASIDGLTMLDLNKFKLPDGSPKISLNTVEISRTFVDYKNLPDSDYRQSISFGTSLWSSIDISEPFRNYPVSMDLPHHLKHLTFRFTGLDLLAPHQVKYTYFMRGFDDSWSSPSSENKAEYRSLSPGYYTFMFRAIGAAKEWSPPFSYSFTINSPWWLRWWAKIIYLVGASTLIATLSHRRMAALKQRQVELENAVAERTAEVLAQKAEVVAQRNRSDELLLNILPAAVAEELKETGHTQPVHFPEVSIMFADFYEFTNIVASIPGKKLVEELDEIFQYFDDIMDSQGLEKIQTVGDAYVAAGGLPKEDPCHAINCVSAGKLMIDYLHERNKKSAIKWKLRVGIHSGPITAGVVGKKKFSYDVFGDTVNIAARIESSSEADKISVSAYTYDLIRHKFPCTYRGKINAKGKGELDMYFVS